MSTFVLIHGSGHGAWCWKKVAPLLQWYGHTVIALDLPGCGDDPAPIGEQSLETYTRRIVETLNAQPEPVILVGHSFGGAPISLSAEAQPEKVAALVYLAAVLLASGQCCADFFPLLALPEDSPPGVYPLLDILGKDTLGAMLYDDCSEEDIAFAVPKLGNEAIAAIQQPVKITSECFGSVPRVYITTLHDHTMPPELQQVMYTATPCQHVFSLETGHSPFFSAPEKLAAVLHDVALLYKC